MQVSVTQDANTGAKVEAAGPATIGLISPTALSGNTDNWNPTGLATANGIRMGNSSGGSVNLTGIVAQGEGRRLTLINVSAQSIVLKHQATSTAANQFIGPNDADVTVRKDGWIDVIYDAISASWRIQGA